MITAEQLVNREVIYCVSGLISDLARNDSGEYYDEILSVCHQDNWIDAAYDNGLDTNDPDEAREYCESNGIDPYTAEAYEHWIVSDWFADRLSAYGEMVSKDIHGLTVWGRCTTGQAIWMDSVIQSIVTDLHATVATY